MPGEDESRDQGDDLQAKECKEGQKNTRLGERHATGSPSQTADGRTLLTQYFSFV